MRYVTLGHSEHVLTSVCTLQLCYTAITSVFTMISVVMILVGVKDAGGIGSIIWVAFDCMCIVF